MYLNAIGICYKYQIECSYSVINKRKLKNKKV